MSQIFHRSANTIARVSIFGAVFFIAGLLGLFAQVIDDRLRVIEQALKAREEVDWKKNNPETKARANDMSSQLLEAIEKLESELAAAEKSGDKKAAKAAADALEARRTWLNALGG